MPEDKDKGKNKAKDKAKDKAENKAKDKERPLSEEKEIYLKVLDGPLKEKKFLIKEGLKIGRWESLNDIVLEGDTQASSIHAIVKRDDSKGILELIDHHSSNGLWIGDEKVDKIPLSKMTKTVFQIGKTSFQIEGPGGEILSWQEGLKKFFQQKEWPDTQESKDFLLDIQPFNPMMDMLFTKGIQLATRWILGYGPRIFGARHLEFPLEDEDALPQSFCLQPTPEEPFFSTAFPDKILFNQKSVFSSPIQTGDIISFGETEITLSFLSKEREKELELE